MIHANVPPEQIRSFQSYSEPTTGDAASLFTVWTVPKEVKGRALSMRVSWEYYSGAGITWEYWQIKRGSSVRWKAADHGSANTVHSLPRELDIDCPIQPGDVLQVYLTSVAQDEGAISVNVQVADEPEQNPIAGTERLPVDQYQWECQRALSLASELMSQYMPMAPGGAADAS